MKNMLRQIEPFYILYKIRQHNKASVYDLIGTLYDDTGSAEFGMAIISLVHHNFINVFDNENEITQVIRQCPSNFDLSDGYKVIEKFKGSEKQIIFKMNDFFYRFQDNLKFRLTAFIENRIKEEEERYTHLTIKPIFSSNTNRLLSPDVLVIMPFDENIMQIYYDHIYKVCKKNKLQSFKADDVFMPNVIMEDIWQCIKNAKLIICDCTNKNANVFYELGIAHAIGKTVICITQNESDIPFDIKHIRYIKYEYTPRGMIAFEKTLEKFIKEEFNNN